MLAVVDEDGTMPSGGSLLDEPDGTVRGGARRMPAAALKAEAHACTAELADVGAHGSEEPVALGDGYRDQHRWRAVPAPRLPAVPAAARFARGPLMELPEAAEA
ncbi:hypothetical protein GCM10018793_45050 [Streptomyces sulfonofaciens]|uniref:Uncharacterized protein n=1 Tax=Streptomyces sulfonofaciens TaxID=68272 RepID=A0A919L4N4_9ACTN|nr:hypothetical protein [Streptomyces sulfonofaciens]GHH83319.1 hypothetical protein GCM10018793_45050 [Streptomyces sulfonofaciens]